LFEHFVHENEVLLQLLVQFLRVYYDVLVYGLGVCTVQVGSAPPRHFGFGFDLVVFDLVENADLGAEQFGEHGDFLVLLELEADFVDLFSALQVVFDLVLPQPGHADLLHHERAGRPVEQNSQHHDAACVKHYEILEGQREFDFAHHDQGSTEAHRAPQCTPVEQQEPLEAEALASLVHYRLRQDQHHCARDYQNQVEQQNQTELLGQVVDGVAEEFSEDDSRNQEDGGFTHP